MTPKGSNGLSFTNVLSNINNLPKGFMPLSLAGLGLSVFAYTLYNSTYTVSGGFRSIIYSRLSGVQPTIYSEGLHFRIPWIQRPIIYDIRVRPHMFRSPTGSKDLQVIDIGLRVLHRPDQQSLPQIYRQLGMDYPDRVLPSICNETLKSVVAQFNASQLITQRPMVSQLVRDQLIERAKDFNIILDDVSLTDLSFSPEYTAAIEEKQVAQQDAQRAQFYVERAKQERQEKVVKAEGESVSALMLGKAMQSNPGYLKLRKLRAAQNIAKTISSSNNRAFLDSEGLMLNLNITKSLSELD